MDVVPLTSYFFELVTYTFCLSGSGSRQNPDKMGWSRPTVARFGRCDSNVLCRGYPLLGDGMYDYRVKHLMGRKVVSGPEFTQVNRAQVLPPATREL
jgi:hypothetical protein